MVGFDGKVRDRIRDQPTKHEEPSQSVHIHLAQPIPAGESFIPEEPLKTTVIEGGHCRRRSGGNGRFFFFLPFRDFFFFFLSFFSRDGRSKYHIIIIILPSAIVYHLSLPSSNPRCLCGGSPGL